MSENIHELAKKAVDRAPAVKVNRFNTWPAYGNLPCFLTGGEIESVKATAGGHVNTQEDGERIVKMFDGYALFVHKPNEENAGSVIIGVNQEHKFAVELLDMAVFENHGIITKELVQSVIKTYCEARQIPVPVRKPIVPNKDWNPGPPQS